jgi:hypothetical protein
MDLKELETKRRIKEQVIKVNSLKYALGFARYDRPTEVEWLEAELVKAETKLAKLTEQL